jgi:macrolide transport system ATP-binding/permease protein
MLLLETFDIEKSYGHRQLFKIDNLKIYSHDKIGIVGINGCGKTTLLDILTGNLPTDKGFVTLYGSLSYIKQLGEETEAAPGNLEDIKISKEFGIDSVNTVNMSGGERTRLKIAKSLGQHCNILIADEPTSNLDIEGVKLLEQKIKAFEGAVVLVSHDRQLLDTICNKIIEIEDGRINIYNGNYSDYKKQKVEKIARMHFEYGEYIEEKQRLNQSILKIRQRTKGMKKAPSRMGNSEARLHKRGSENIKGKLHGAIKSIETRIEQLEVKERPKNLPRINLQVNDQNQLYSRVAIRGTEVNKSFGDRILFKNANFTVYNGNKVALMGSNGCGKTTLINMIIQGHPSIESSKTTKIGYLSQSLDTLDKNESILDNIVKDSIYPQSFIRTVLANLNIRGDDINKNVDLLSGGERVKVGLARVLVSDFNMIILDEPTNYLDIYSQEALENMLRDYDGTLMFVSHDRRFIDNIADSIIYIKAKAIISYQGSYSDYLKSLELKEQGSLKEQLIVLENNLTNLISRLSMPSKNDNIEDLDVQYRQTLIRVREIKSQMS